MKIGIVGYGLGNLASVSRAVSTIGYEPFIAHRPEEIRAASRIIVPGVGAFAQGMDRLNELGWTEELKRLTGDGGRPLLGICLGMQFLASNGTEGGDRDGLGFIPGSVRGLSEMGCTQRIPHVGWNTLHIARPDEGVFHQIPDETDVYFVHSYGFRAENDADLLAYADYQIAVPAIVRRGPVWGMQFHPEKSSKAGLQFLRNFIEKCEC